MASIFLRYLCLMLVLSLGSLYFYAASVKDKTLAIQLNRAAALTEWRQLLGA